MPRLITPETTESFETSHQVQIWLLASIGMLLFTSLLTLIFTS